MKFFLLSDNLDTLLGMRLAGVNGALVQTEEELKNNLREVLEDSKIAIVLLTSNVVGMCKEYVLDLKLRIKSPLLVEIPSGTDAGKYGGSMVDYIHKTTGMTVSF